jgi:diguanylate cyclase (GGDEF)-like protein
MDARIVRVLFVEDEENDVVIISHQIKKDGLQIVAERVETEAQLRSALEHFRPDVVLSDFQLPQFDGHAALRTVLEVAPHVPFVFVSGTIGEQRAIDALLEGASDYILKDNLKRIVPAIRRALEYSAARIAREQQERQIERLSRVLRMLSGINSIIVRIQGNAELFEEACRLAVRVGGYSGATVALKAPAEIARPAAAFATDEVLTKALHTFVLDSSGDNTNLIRKVVQSRTPLICNAPTDPLATMQLSSIMKHSGFRSLVALPLLADQTVLGILILVAEDGNAFSEEEMQMLREVSANLSFALQFLNKQNTLRLLSHFDPITGLARRELLCERLTPHLGRLNASSEMALAIVDVKQLSVLNDSFGRHTGDQLLQHIAERLRRFFSDSDLLAHFGGGTFAIGMSDEQGTASTGLSQRIAALFEQAFTIEGRDVPVIVRSGIAVATSGTRDADVLVQNAEAALHTGRTTNQLHTHYSAAHHTHAVAQLALEHKLRRALELDQFELHYQPKMGLQSRRIEGAEALLRWRDPEQGLISPGEFLPLLERTGLIIDVGDWVLRQAAADCQYWLQQGLPTVRVAINISPLQLENAEFVARFLEMTQAWATGRCGLDIEITESSLLEGSQAEIEKLERLRSHGVRVAIDDFGTGYSSLGRLSSLPIDTLKIDRSFISRLPNDRSGRTVVETILTLARAFGMDTVAEGVETAEQLQALGQMQCDQVQGYLISRPAPRDAFTQMLTRGNGEFLSPAESAASGASGES